MLISISKLIRKAAEGIPESWKQWKKDKPTDTPPEALLKDKANKIRKEVHTKTIKEPSYFSRDLNKIISYMNGVRDPKKHGLSQELANFSNDVSDSIRKGNPVELSVEVQKSIVDSAEKLTDDGTLLSKIEKLFQEDYQDKKRERKASIVEALRSFVANLR